MTCTVASLPLCRPAGWIAQWRKIAMCAALNGR